MDRSPEYKIIGGPITDCQKTLNQWKHKFDLNIIQMCALDNPDEAYVIILLIRSRRI